jgi:hypothetical protein
LVRKGRKACPGKRGERKVKNDSTSSPVLRFLTLWTVRATSSASSRHSCIAAHKPSHVKLPGWAVNDAIRVEEIELVFGVPHDGFAHINRCAGMMCTWIPMWTRPSIPNMAAHP